jgi:uncharacterized membrane protein YesL
VRDVAERWANFVLANLLWALLVIPVVTIPAATAGIFAVMTKRVRHKPSQLFDEFFSTMRRVWLKATIIGVIDAAIGGLLVLNMWIFQQMGALDVIGMLARSVSLFVGLILVLTNLYVWPLLVSSEMDLRQVIDTAIKLAAAYPLRSLGVLIGAVIPIVITIFLLPRGAFFFVTISTCVMIVVMGTWPVIRQHVPEDALISY